MANNDDFIRFLVVLLSSFNVNSKIYLKLALIKVCLHDTFYETLVNAPQSAAKKLVEFCDLTCRNNCLHIDKNSAPVATASAVQVRSSINNRSVGNWKKYENHLGKVIAILKQANIELE